MFFFFCCFCFALLCFAVMLCSKKKAAFSRGTLQHIKVVHPMCTGPSSCIGRPCHLNDITPTRRLPKFHPTRVHFMLLASHSNIVIAWRWKFSLSRPLILLMYYAKVGWASLDAQMIDLRWPLPAPTLTTACGYRFLLSHLVAINVSASLHSFQHSAQSATPSHVISNLKSAMSTVG
jgi:hypothetical protein